MANVYGVNWHLASSAVTVMATDVETECIKLPWEGAINYYANELIISTVVAC